MSEAARPASESVILEERDGAVLTIRLNRPDRLNALNVELGTALAAALRRASDDAAVRAVVLTGAGRAFCGGGDVAVLRDARIRNAAERADRAGELGERNRSRCWPTMPKPVSGLREWPCGGRWCESRDCVRYSHCFGAGNFWPELRQAWALSRFWRNILSATARGSIARARNCFIPAR